MISDIITKVIGDFMGWDYWVGSGGSYYTSGDIYGDFITHNPLTDWNDWKLVENRIREKDLWEDYVEELTKYSIWRANKKEHRGGYPAYAAYCRCVMMAADIDQRARALMRVLEDTDGMVS